MLILDEPCSGLDLVAREQLLNTLEELGSAPDAPVMILVTHHLEEITPVFSHVFLLKEGRCLARGSKRDMLQPDLLSETFGIRIEAIEERNRFWARIDNTH